MYFNLNFCNPSFNSRYKLLLSWYLLVLVPTRYLNHIQRNSFMFILCMNYAYDNHLTSTNSSYLFAQKSLQCKQTSSADISCCCEIYMSPARIHTVLQCKDSKEIRLLHRHWYIQSIPIEFNFVLNDNTCILLHLF